MKAFYFSLAAVIMVTACVASTIRTDCTYIPECPSQNSPNFTVHVPYKDDCHKFYKCNSKCGYLMECPKIGDTEERLIFNPKLQVCDWPDNLPEGICSTTSTSSTSSTTLSTPSTSSTTLSTSSTFSTTTATPTTTPSASLNCDIPRKCSARGITKIIHENDCRKYYICRDGEKDPEPRECQEGHLFNPIVSECDETANTKCFRTDECHDFDSSQCN